MQFRPTAALRQRYPPRQQPDRQVPLPSGHHHPDEGLIFNQKERKFAHLPVQFAGSQQDDDGDDRCDGDHRSVGCVRRASSSCGVRSSGPMAFHHKNGCPGSRAVLAEEISWTTQGRRFFFSRRHHEHNGNEQHLSGSKFIAGVTIWVTRNIDDGGIMEGKKQKR